MAHARVDEQRPLLTIGALLAAVGLGRAVHFGNGMFNPEAIVALLSATLTLLVGWMAPTSKRGLNRFYALTGVLCVGALSVQFALFASAAPAMYLQITSVEQWSTFQKGVAAAAVCSGLSLAEDKGTRRAGVVGMLAAYCVLGDWLIRSSPQPAIDVWHIHRESLDQLLQGVNPYELTFPNLYGDDRYFGPGMVRDQRLQFGYTYPPLSLLLSVPGHLWGDYRYSLLACNAATAALMILAGRARLAAAAAALFLFTPRSLFVLEQGWTEPMLLFLLALVSFCARRLPRGLPWAAGLMLASKQYAFLFAPALLLLPQVTKSRAALFAFAWRAAAIAAAITLPLALWAPKPFVHAVFLVQLGLPFRPDALNFSAYWVSLGHAPPPGFLGWAMLIPAYLMLWLRAPRTPAGFALAAGTVMLAFVLFNRQAFGNYYFFILGALLVGAAFSLDECYRPSWLWRRTPE